MSNGQADGEPQSTSFDYEVLVKKGAGLVHDGHITVADIEIPTRIQEAPAEPDFTAEELRDDVRAYLDEHTPAPEPDEDDVEERTVTGGVDWDALWSEFGFDTKGPLGTYFATPLQLQLTLEVSDQATGNPAEHISQAVDEGVLVEITAEDTHGGSATRGYALQRGGGA